MTPRLCLICKEWPNGRSTGGRAVAAHQKRERAAAFSPASIADAGARQCQKGSNDRGSGERGARLEWRAAWRDKDNGCGIEVLD